MQLNASEISELIKSKIQNLAAGAEMRTQGTVVSVTDGICRIHGLSDVMQGEMLEFPGNTFGLALNLERDSVGAVVLGEYEHITEGDTVKCTGRILEVPVGPGAARARGQLAGPADRRQGSDQRQDDRRHREGRAGRDLAQVGVAAGADRPQGDRRDGADRPRPARADHRRPPDRQDRGRGRHDHQPEGQGPVLRLRRDRPEGVHHRQRGAQARRARRDGVHRRRRRLRLRVRGDAVHRALLRLHHGRVLPRSRPGRADHLRRPDQAGLGVPPDLAAAAPSAGPRSLSGRRVLPALPSARARRARERGARSSASPRARSRARPAR